MKRENTEPGKINRLRKKAEALAKIRAGEGKETAINDPQLLIHELRVHQIELEMQNEELRRAQEELEESRQRYADLYDFAPVGYLTLDKKGLILESNLTGAQMLGIERRNLVQGLFSRLVGKKDHPVFYSHFKEALETETRQTCELTITRANGLPFYARLESIAVCPGNGKPHQVRIAFIDITKQKEAEHALQQREEEFRALVENAPDIIERLGKDLRNLYINAAGEAATGITRETFIGKTHKELGIDKWFSLAWEDACRKVFTTGLKEVIECEAPGSGGMNYYQSQIVPEFEKGGSIASLLSISHDITNRKQDEEKVKRSLREKEILLQEVHHRVKNNLQVISSLLNMSKNRAQSQEARDLLQEAISKVHAVALIHSQIYKNEELDCIDMARNIQILVIYLSQTYADRTKSITPVIECPDILLPVGKALTCILILNELITNAYKYAFVEREQGTIEISMEKGTDGDLCIRVKDDGIGMPEGINLEKADTLGLALVRDLVHMQPDGSLEIKGDVGTEISMRFKLSEK